VGANSAELSARIAWIALIGPIAHKRVLHRYLSCCSVLQCVAVFCRVLQGVAVLQCVAVYCSALQCVAACCSALQCVAEC